MSRFLWFKSEVSLMYFSLSFSNWKMIFLCWNLNIFYLDKFYLIIVYNNYNFKWVSFVSSIRHDKKQFLAPGFSYFGHEDVPEDFFQKCFKFFFAKSYYSNYCLFTRYNSYGMNHTKSSCLEVAADAFK